MGVNDSYWAFSINQRAPRPRPNERESFQRRQIIFHLPFRQILFHLTGGDVPTRAESDEDATSDFLDLQPWKSCLFRQFGLDSHAINLLEHFRLDVLNFLSDFFDLPPRWFSIAQGECIASRRSPVVFLNSRVSDSP